MNVSINIRVEDLVSNLTYLYAVGVSYATTESYTYNLEKLRKVLK